MDFWDNLPKPFFALAPMEGVTDLVFRQVVAKAARPDVFFTEFTNVNSFASEQGRANALSRLAFSPTEAPIVAQIWGSQPQNFSLTAQGLAELGYQAIDINMGCPDKNVVKTGGGSALIQNPKLAQEIIASTKQPFQASGSSKNSSGIAISVKTRLGYSRVEEWRDWLSLLLQQDLAALTVHLRTKKEMSKVSAHHELIPDIKRLRDQLAPHTKLIINGDIKNRTQGLKLAKQYLIDGIMIGRGVFEDPYCFELYHQTHNSQELLQLLTYHLDLFDQTSRSDRFDSLKRFFKVYLRDFNGAKQLREQLMHTKSTTEARQILLQCKGKSGGNHEQAS